MSDITPSGNVISSTPSSCGGVNASKPECKGKSSNGLDDDNKININIRVENNDSNPNVRFNPYVSNANTTDFRPNMPRPVLAPNITPVNQPATFVTTDKNTIIPVVPPAVAKPSLFQRIFGTTKTVNVENPLGPAPVKKVKHYDPEFI